MQDCKTNPHLKKRVQYSVFTQLYVTPTLSRPITMGTATTLATLHLTENTDLVAWSPREPNELAVGTYQLDKSSGVRSGHVYLYALEGADEEEQRLSLAREWAGPGVFEMAWAGAGLGDQGPLLAVALTDGSVRILDAQLRELARTDESEEDALTCCFCWLEEPRCGSASATLLASYSDGSAERFQVRGCVMGCVYITDCFHAARPARVECNDQEVGCIFSDTSPAHYPSSTHSWPSLV